MTTVDRPPQSVQKMLDELDRLRDLDWGLLFQRSAEWVKPVLPANGQRGGGSSAPSDRDLADQLLDRAASRYHAELQAIVREMHDRAARIVRIAGFVMPPPPVVLRQGQMLNAQVANEGWCVSCWRNDKRCEPIALRPSGEPYYKDLCRPCGEWKAEHGTVPPLSILRLRHDGRRVTQKDVENALGTKR
jgi:hypothetical protein